MSEPVARKPLQRRHIEVLVAIGDHSSVHRAARSLKMPQPAASRLLGEAQKLVGAQLFERSSYGSTPTVPGEKVLASARVALRAMERLHDVASASGPIVRLGCIPRAMHAVVPRLLERAYPSPSSQNRKTVTATPLRFSVAEGSSAALLEELARGKLDFAIVRRSSSVPGVGEQFIVERLYDERIVVVCDASNGELPRTPFALARLIGQRWILPLKQTSSRVVFDQFWGDRGFEPIEPVIEVRSFESNLALVAGSRFISIAPESIARRQASYGVLRVLKLRPALPVSPVVLASTHGAADDPVLARFRKLVFDAAKIGMQSK